MKIDFVLTACNLTQHYLCLYPYVVKVWKEKFNLDCKLILISPQIPPFLSKYKENIILFKPIENVHDIFVAQVIRILYPCLFPNKNILITDVDIFPISKEYFIDSISNIKDDCFVTYRNAYLTQKMFAICYNVANSETWKEIFKITNIEDLITTIKMWYNHKYDGRKNCDGWFTDQQRLYEYVMNWKVNNPTRLVILKDNLLKFNRLDKRQRKYIIQTFSEAKNNIIEGKYTDFHSIHPYSRYKQIIKALIDAICSTKEKI